MRGGITAAEARAHFASLDTAGRVELYRGLPEHEIYVWSKARQRLVRLHYVYAWNEAEGRTTIVRPA